MNDTKFTNIFNFRDISQINTPDNNCIIPGKLFRSGFPFNDTKDDIKKLSDLYNIKYIIDFRSNEECEAHPIPEQFIKTFKCHHLPVVKNWSHYIKANTTVKVNDEKRFSVDDVTQIYCSLPFWNDCQNAYQKFVDILISSDNNPVLWFCSWGKDRTGIAAIILEYIFEYDWEFIYNDYLLTNYNYKNILEFNKNLPKNLIDTFSNPSFYANKIYIDKMLHAIRSECGSFKDYLEKFMKIDGHKICALQNKYLINSK